VCHGPVSPGGTRKFCWPQVTQRLAAAEAAIRQARLRQRQRRQGRRRLH